MWVHDCSKGRALLGSNIRMREPNQRGLYKKPKMIRGSSVWFSRPACQHRKSLITREPFEIAG